MQATFDRAKLLEAFGLVGAVAPPRSPKEIYQSVLLVCDGESATLRATDGELSISETIPVKGAAEGGSVLIPVSRGLPILREASGDEVSISLKDNKVVIESKGSRFRLPSRDASEFPCGGDLQKASTFSVDAGQLASSIAQTIFAVDTSLRNGRFSLGGTLWINEGDKLTLAASCGRRVAVTSIDCPTDSPISEPNTIVPHKALRSIQNACRAYSGDATVYSGHSKLTVQVAEVTITTSLIEGRFAPFRRIVSADRIEEPCSIDRIELDTAIRQASICTDKESLGIQLEFDGQGSLVITAASAEAGASRIDCSCDGGTEGSCRINAKMLSEFVRSAEGDKVLVDTSTIDRQFRAECGDVALCIALMGG